MHRISEFSTFVEKVPIFEARKEGFGDPRGGGRSNLTRYCEVHVFED